MYYEVIRYFKDAQDNGYAYREGDTYPRAGHTVSDARIKDLLSGNNFQRVPLLKRVDAVAHFVNESKPTSEEVIEEVLEEAVLEEDVPEVEEATPEVKPEPKEGFTAEEIDKMPFMKLKSVARKNGVPVEDREARDIREDLKKEFGV